MRAQPGRSRWAGGPVEPAGAGRGQTHHGDGLINPLSTPARFLFSKRCGGPRVSLLASSVLAGCLVVRWVVLTASRHRVPTWGDVGGAEVQCATPTPGGSSPKDRMCSSLVSDFSATASWCLGGSLWWDVHWEKKCLSTPWDPARRFSPHAGVHPRGDSPPPTHCAFLLSSLSPECLPGAHVGVTAVGPPPPALLPGGG